VFDGSVFSLLTAANETPGTGFRPLGWQPQPNSALYLGFDTEVTGKPFPQQIRLRVFLPGAALAGVAQNSREVRQPPRPPVSIEWEYRQTETRWRRMNVFEDGSSAFTREGDIVLEGPTTEIVPTIEGREPTQLHWLRARLVSGNYPAGREPEIDFIRPNTIKVVNLATVREEVVGTSDGEPRQAFRVRNIPAAFNSLTLAVSAENDTLETWTRVDDFFASGPDDPHYTLNHSSGEIVFGNGSRGRIPPAAAQIVAREYRYGGGKSGNVGAQLITVPMTALAGVEKVANERPAVGGRDEQPLEELLEEAPRTLRHRNRSVTADDFAALAQDAGGIARATAIGLAHPGHPGVEVPGAVTVVVVPDNDDVPPQPSSDLIRSVCRYLDGFRLLTTELFVKGPEYRRIRVDAAVEAQAYASFDAVAQDIVTAINRYLAPLGGRQADGSRAPGWPFGQDLRPTNLFNVILDVKNVVGVKTLQIYVDGQPHALQDPVRLPPDGLLYGSDHVITVGPAEDL
jgi:predicted phage baseplate assembly protein